MGNSHMLCHDRERFGETSLAYLKRLWGEANKSAQASLGRCNYLGPEARDPVGNPVTQECGPCGGKTRLKVFQCFHPGHILNPRTTFTDCKNCPDFVSTEEKRAEENSDHLDVADLGAATSVPKRLNLCHGDGSMVNLKNHFMGRTALFIGGGTSLRSVDLDAIQKNHIITLAVNNVAELMKPMLWVCVDNPVNFPAVIFDDPNILKIIPRGWADHHLDDDKMVDAHPSVLFFRRNGWFRPEQFLSESTFNWGNSEGVCDKIGYCGGRSVMLVAIKLLYYLGCRRVVLLGCDFAMSESEPYAHSEAKDKNAVESNNRKYRCLNDRFRALRPHFQEAGLEVLNASEGSRLDAFPFVKLADVLGTIEQEVTD